MAAAGRFLQACGYFAAGAICGFGSLIAGIAGLLLAALASGLVLLRARERPEAVGAYMLGLGVIGASVTLSIVLRMPSCDTGLRSAGGECYAPITGPASMVYGLIAGVGLLGIGFLLIRRRHP